MDLALEETLKQLEETLNRELAALEAAGHELTPEEQRQIESLQRSLEGIGQSAESHNGVPTMPQDAAGDVIYLRDGRYAAANAQFQADFRLDTAQTAIMSIDLFQGSGASRTYLASLRSNPGVKIRRGRRRFGVIGEDEDGNQARGTVELTPLSETQASVKITLDRGLNGLPVNLPFVMSATWQSQYFRTIGLEIDQEENVTALPGFPFNGTTVTLESCFADAGLEMVSVGQRDTIPGTSQGWDDSQLHGLMVRFANESLSKRAWTLHLLVLSEAQMAGLLGVMFDTGESDENGLPRQGAAVFATPMLNHPAGFERKILQTTAHELGHALNLAHRFERVVSRADSTSFMNYDWRYLGGSRSDQFWRDFSFTFDPDEIRFFRHAPLAALIPGGVDFHTVNYWSDGTGGYSPYVPEVELQGLELMLHPPIDGTLFNFAQPVLLTIELKNTSNRSLNIPREMLDPKSGFLEVMVKRLGRKRKKLNEDQFVFSPIVNRCWDFNLTGADIVPSGGSMTDNLNLTFGSAGFTFGEPGNYEVTAVLSIFDRTRGVDQIVRSNPLRIRIAYPQSLEEERDAIDIFRKDVGYYLTLGGSDVLTEAAETLEDIRQRRQGKSKEITDPLVANIVRAQAINYSREFISYQDGKYKTRAANTSKAINLLSQLEASSEHPFDPATQKGNRALMERLKKKK
jgi:hypothetical protein